VSPQKGVRICAATITGVDLNAALGEQFFIIACVASAGDKFYFSRGPTEGIDVYDRPTGRVSRVRNDGASEMLVAGGTLYWANYEGLHAAPLQGGHAELIYAGQCRSLHSDGTALYWVSGYRLLKMAL
jgi:hypothetical protein